ncbi:hypothetical protein LTS18_011886 [Coniosporium uncinatum]|uniref:Uncharacterized protein n=1 Tax=Coniosporium uncinatum TaxID=93489 RepID=A0ACC3DD57_9PEZI|nr:hypothetical protein LTS18_011886 [Coniosporium uncinatum]
MPGPSSPAAIAARKAGTNVDVKAVPLAKKLNLGNDQGSQNNAKVQDKIRKWQERGAAVVEVEDAAASDSGSKSSAKEKSARSAKSSKGRSVKDEDLVIVVIHEDESETPALPLTPLKVEEVKIEERSPKPASAHRITKPQHNTLDEDVLAATTPKKRVISDGHWRRKRSPPKEKEEPKKKESTPEIQGVWVRPTVKKFTEEKVVVNKPEEPEIKPVWVRPALLPRPEDKPIEIPRTPSPEKPVRLITARRKSAAAPKSSNSSEDIASPRSAPPPKGSVEKWLQDEVDDKPRVYIRKRRQSAGQSEKLGSAVRELSFMERNSGSVFGDGIRIIPSQKVRKHRVSASADDVERLDADVVTNSRDDGMDGIKVYSSRRRRRRRSKPGDEDVYMSGVIDRSRTASEGSDSYESQPKQASRRRRRRSKEDSAYDDESYEDIVPPPPHSLQRKSRYFSWEEPPPHNASGDEQLDKRRRSRRKGSPRQSRSAEEEDYTERRPRHRNTRSRERAEHDRGTTYDYSEMRPRSSHRTDNVKANLYRDGYSSDHAPRRPFEPTHEQTRQDSRQPSYTIEPEVLATPRDLQSPPRVYGNRIDAWLSSTPNSFSDDKSSIAPSRASDPLPRDNKSEYTQVSSETTATSADYPRSSGKIKHNRTPSGGLLAAGATLGVAAAAVAAVDHEAESDYASSTSTLSLKRSSARRNLQTPTKERSKTSPLKESTPADDDLFSTAPSSPVDPSVFNARETTPTRTAAFPSRRPFPSTGKRLSTIASVETFHTKQHAPPSIAVGSEIHSAPPSVLDDAPSTVGTSVVDSVADSTSTARVKKTGLRRRLTKHDDLMSVLSIPENHNRSIVSARSIRTNRSRLATATVPDLMNELASDEANYKRELRTLVDGVIPVLLKCVLSKSDAAKAAGLFNRMFAGKDDPHATKPIVDMGVALERLKSTHQRIPQGNPEALLIWAQNAHKVYVEYVRVWRMGFQDVVVNLAPSIGNPRESGAWDEGLPRNKEGDIVNSDGERVDVAFLLKRPLVRLKYLAKTLKGLNFIHHSTKAEDLANKYQDLVNEARRRANEERARLEDEAAASIDATRARDPRSLAPLAGVSVDPMRCVRARDFFDMHVQHSSGQEVDCRVELLVRDDAPGYGNSGDLLICEVDGTGRWLFFPPMLLGRVSARKGDEPGELVVMLRGVQSGGEQWHELLTLQTNDDEAATEWMNMMGLTPVPNALPTREKSFRAPKGPPSSVGSSALSTITESTAPLKSRTPSPREIEIPIGEQGGAEAKRWSYQTTPERYTARSDTEVSPVTPPSSDERLKRQPKGNADSPLRSSFVSDDPHKMPTKARPSRYHQSPERSSRPATATSDGRSSNYRPPTANTAPATPSGSTVGAGGRGFQVWFPPADQNSDDVSDEEESTPLPKKGGRPELHRRTSSVPSLDLPAIPRLRKGSPETPEGKAEERSGSMPITLSDTSSSAPSKLQKKPPVRSDIPSSTPSKLQKKPPASEEKPPPPPPHRSPSSTKPAVPTFTPPSHKPQRRASSPLKHEYQPSTASDTTSESDSYASEASDTSETSDEDDEDIPIGLLPLRKAVPAPKITPPESLNSLPDNTLSPSQSASQSPYRTVPKSALPTAKSIASIFCWSDKGMWESLHSEECSISITSGLIEAFKLNAIPSRPSTSDASSAPSSEISRPLVALELTPLVPLRRGTALDISIRSPPTASSTLHPQSTNIMFRSRSPEECEALYNLINHARINNPTYIALQNARGPYGESSWAAAMDRRNAMRTASSNSNSGGGGSSWWHSLGGSSRSKSYRASSKRAMSTSAATDSSVNTIGSAFSALRRFSTGQKAFSVAKSSVSWGRSSMTRGTGSSLDMTDSSGGSGSGTSTPAIPEAGGGRGSRPASLMMPVGLGITNAKVRLYVRQSASRWQDLGSARLSIMQPNTPTPLSPPGSSAASTPNLPTLTSPVHGRTVSASQSPGNLRGAPEKRVFVTGKSEDKVLLDVTLGESCFERIARTGIAVSVWEDLRDPKTGQVLNVAATGGVGDRKVGVYMIQMKSERECAFTFSLLGKMRY